MTPTLTFDLTRITARDMQRFFEADRAQDYAAMAAIFARTVTACPPAWGDPASPETYLSLPFFAGFRVVTQQFVQAASNTGESAGPSAS